MFKDAKIISKDSPITMNDISIMIQTVLHQKINMIKSISFPQFLDCVFAISELREPGLFNASPKAALEKVISENFLPLLGRIESLAIGSLTQRSFQQTQNQNFIFSKFHVAQKQIVYNSDTQAIFSDI
jgi:hydrogenase maturation factor HypF (carbamoyltransferase family)